MNTPVKTSYSTQLPNVSIATFQSNQSHVTSLGFSSLQQLNGSTLSVGFNNDTRTCNRSSSFITLPCSGSTNAFLNQTNNTTANRFQGSQSLTNSNIFHSIAVSQKPLCTAGLTSYSGSSGNSGVLNSSVILVPTLQTDGTVSYSLQTQVKISSPIKPCPILPLLSLPHQEKLGEFSATVKPRHPPMILPKFPQPSAAAELISALETKLSSNQIRINSRNGLFKDMSVSMSQIKQENDISTGKV